MAWVIVFTLLLALPRTATRAATDELFVQSAQTTERQEPRALQYSTTSPTVVTQELPELLKAIRDLKGLNPAQSQDELPEILAKVGSNVKAFFENFPNTASVEKISMEGLGVRRTMDTFRQTGGLVAQSYTQKFQYLALAHPYKGGAGIEEYRTNAKGERVDPGGVGGSFFVTKGFVSMSLNFHPDYRADSSFRFLGRQLMNKRQTYVIAFAQKPEIAHLAGRLGFEGTSILFFTQGIAWFDSTSYQIIRMRTELLKSHQEIGPKRLTTDIEFQEVRFKESSQVLWLPLQVEVEVDWKGNVYRNRHRYSNFKLFAVGTEQEIRTREAAPSGPP